VGFYVLPALTLEKMVTMDNLEFSKNDLVNWPNDQLFQILMVDHHEILRSKLCDTITVIKKTAIVPNEWTSSSHLNN
jgi:hypothetical protein